MTVKSYLNDKNTSPLHFFLDSSAYKSYFEQEIPETAIEQNNTEELKQLPLPELIVKVIYLTQYFKSENELGKIETGFAKNRSSLDIWRHVKYYLPDVTIYDIMHELFKLNYDHFYTLFCPDIKRRVFHWYCLRASSNHDVNYRDEYGLTYYDWETIKEE